MPHLPSFIQSLRVCPSLAFAFIRKRQFVHTHTHILFAIYLVKPHQFWSGHAGQKRTNFLTTGRWAKEHQTSQVFRKKKKKKHFLGSWDSIACVPGSRPRVHGKPGMQWNNVTLSGSANDSACLRPLLSDMPGLLGSPYHPGRNKNNLLQKNSWEHFIFVIVLRLVIITKFEVQCPNSWIPPNR